MEERHYFVKYDENGNYAGGYNLKHTEGIDLEGYVEVTEEEFEEITNPQPEEPTEEELTILNLQNELYECHSKLKEMDYIGVKIATGRATKEEYAEEIAEMTRLANRINEIEDILGGEHNAAV